MAAQALPASAQPEPARVPGTDTSTIVPPPRSAAEPGRAALPPLDAITAIVAAIGMAAALATTIQYRNRLLALITLGAVGLVVALAFVRFSAPDLALTQVLVEFATIVLMMLALRWLPNDSPAERKASRAWRDGAIALLAGIGVSVLAWTILESPHDPISTYFLETSLPLGGGSNVVNVILVDYRGFDTLGEITVLGIAGVAIHALLSGFMPPPDANRIASNASTTSMLDAHPMMLYTVARVLLPLAVLVSIYLFLRGHNEPGGGFIAGLVFAIALILQFVADGRHYVTQRIHTDFTPFIGWGLLIAGGTGLGSWFFDAPFLTSTHGHPVWPWVGEVPLASAALFDLGVYLTVIGATMVSLASISKLGTRTARAR